MMHTPAFWYQPRGAVSALLWPLSLLYRFGRWLHVLCSRPQTFAVPVICVGNAVAGGAGKTPTVLALVHMLREGGVTPHIVTRGYKGKLRGPLQVAPVHTATDVGDEALLLAAVAPTWVARDRAAGIKAAIAAGATCILMDDGLQNPRIKASANLLVVDSAAFGNGCLLPAGPLREPLAALLPRVDAVITINAPVPDAVKDKPVFRAVLMPDIAGLDVSKRYVAFSGMARPEKFFATARVAGLNVVATFKYPDHHILSEREWLSLQRMARECDAHLLTTTKDAARFDPRQRGQLRILPVALTFDDRAPLRLWLKQVSHG
ncbi:MAG: tetraacyldisaccharide 4'-kinase [Bdellovibrionales bacterium]